MAFPFFDKDIVTRSEYNDLMVFENAEYERNFISTPITPTSTVEDIDVDPVEKPTDDIQVKSKWIWVNEIRID